MCHEIQKAENRCSGPESSLKTQRDVSKGVGTTLPSRTPGGTQHSEMMETAHTARRGRPAPARVRGRVKWLQAIQDRNHTASDPHRHRFSAARCAFSKPHLPRLPRSPTNAVPESTTHVSEEDTDASKHVLKGQRQNRVLNTRHSTAERPEGPPRALVCATQRGGGASVRWFVTLTKDAYQGQEHGWRGEWASLTSCTPPPPFPKHAPLSAACSRS